MLKNPLLELTMAVTGDKTVSTTVTGPALAQHAMGLEPSPNARYYIHPLLTDSSMGYHNRKKSTATHNELKKVSV